MNYAVLDIQGHQYIVSEGDSLVLDKINANEQVKTDTDKVLLIVNDDKVIIGNPYIKNAHVDYQIVEQLKGKKLRVFTYKAKSRYRRNLGFRANQTKIIINKIGINKEK